MTYETTPQYVTYKDEKFELTNTDDYADPVNRWYKVKHVDSGVCIVYNNDLDNPRDYAEEILQFLESQKRGV